jgi:branched-chain amino acid transport system substrate-binding protein
MPASGLSHAWAAGRCSKPATAIAGDCGLTAAVQIVFSDELPPHYWPDNGLQGPGARSWRRVTGVGLHTLTTTSEQETDMFKQAFSILTVAGALGLSPIAAAQVKIAYIDPLSGTFAGIGEFGLKSFNAIIDDINAKGGVLGGQKLELVAMDNKASPEESLTLFKKVTDSGIRYIVQGQGSGAAGALIEAVNKWNDRNPDKTVLFLNYASNDPDLTNGKCSFWYYSFDAHNLMKVEALTNYMAKDKSIKKVFVIGQDYAHGQQMAKAVTSMLPRKRPDVEIVGNDLHPFGKVKDFAPYVAKIKASGADTLITRNLGKDR